MPNPRLQRKFLRAPLKSLALYVDGEHVFKARALNVSEGGLLLAELPHVPDAEVLFVAFDLVTHPLFSTLSPEDLKRLSKEDFPRAIVKSKVRMVRSFENKSNVERAFLKSIGCEFLERKGADQEILFKYIETFAKNTIYLLSLFESLNSRSSQLETLKKVAQLLGYDHQMKIPLLRAKVLHDYQSLESL